MKCLELHQELDLNTITLAIQASNLLLKRRLKKANLPAAIPLVAEHSLSSLSALSVRSSGTDDGKRPNSMEDRCHCWDEQVSTDMLSSGFILQWRRGPGHFATSGARGPGRFAIPGARGPQRTGSYLGGAGSAALARNRIGGAESECTYAQVNVPQSNILNRSKRYIQGRSCLLIAFNTKTHTFFSLMVTNLSNGDGSRRSMRQVARQARAGTQPR
jgi:hypothetical protein